MTNTNGTPSDPQNEADERIDAALRRSFALPDLSPLVSAVQAEAARPAARGWPRALPWLLALAAAALVVVGLLRAPAEDPDHGDGDAIAAQWVSLYRDAVAMGFESPRCCEPALDLAESCRSRFASAVGLAADAEVRICGTPCDRPAGGAVSMMARCGDSPVCLFVVPAESAPRFATRRYGDVSVHRRELGALAVFEVSHAETPRLLAKVYVPEQ